MKVQNVISENDVVLWQSERSEDEPISEPAILIKEYSDVITIQQGDDEINITRSKKNLHTLAKVLRKKGDTAHE